MSVPENKIIFFNPRKGSYIVDVIFIQQPAEDIFPQLQNLPQSYRELLEVTEKVLFQNCRLSQEILDSQYNKQLGTWNNLIQTEEMNNIILLMIGLDLG